MSVNPWHPWHVVSIGKGAPSTVTAIMEIPKGSKNKYEIDKATGMLVLDRVLSSSVTYPINYGFIPQTYCEDGDALDIMVLGQYSTPSLCMMETKVIGYLKMIDGGESDDKILAVHTSDPQYKHFNDISEIQKSNPHLLKEIEQFFKTYKLLENKKVEILGWFDAKAAEKIVQESVQFYKKERQGGLI